MRIHLYTICWNDAAMLGFFFRHYDAFVERYVIYDDGSDVDTLDILHRHPRVEVRPMPRLVPDSYLHSARVLRDMMWKESRGHADWVMVTDVDEHVYHPDLVGYLERCRAEGVTAIPGLGYQMISRSFPDREAVLCRDHRQGVPSRGMNKLALFDPDLIEETRYDCGRHTARPAGVVKYPRHDELLNLHYKHMGVDYVVRRNAELLARLVAGDRPGPREEYGQTAAQLVARIDAWDRAAVDIAGVGRRTRKGHRDPTLPRWWYCPPWWRMRWWHLHWWWSLLPLRSRSSMKAAARAAGAVR